LQRLHISIYLAYSVLLNFLIRSQFTAKTGYITIVRACPKIDGIDIRVGITLKEGIRALSNRALSNKALSSGALSSGALSSRALFSKASSSIYSRGVYK